MIENRSDFERNMNLLVEEMRLGRVHFSAQTKKTIRSLMDVRMTPNKRINLLTINEMARLTANTISRRPMMEANEKRWQKKKEKEQGIENSDTDSNELFDEDFDEDDDE